MVPTPPRGPRAPRCGARLRAGRGKRGRNDAKRLVFRQVERKVTDARLDAAHALVTGATSGIGRAIALKLATQATRVLAVGRDAARAKATQRELLARGTGHLVLAGDLTQAAFIASLAEQAAAWSGAQLRLLVLCAGHHEPASVEQTSAESFDAAIATNLRAPFLLTGALLPALRAARGMIVVVNSSVVNGPRPGVAAYAASKAGLRMFADCLRTEVSQDGIRVLSIFPGRTATPMQRERYEREGLPYAPERLMQPEDVAEAVLDAFGSRAEVTELHLRPLHKL
jgi:NAD(P)-dependent dehydrogenase (short-subunit alcohol dehydrogenase family)